MAADPPTSAAVGPPGPGWHLLSAPLPPPDGLPSASSDAMDARAVEPTPPDALALPHDEPLSSRRYDDEACGTAKRGSQSGKPRRRGDGANGGRGAPLRTTSLTALIEGGQPSPPQSPSQLAVFVYALAQYASTSPAKAGARGYSGQVVEPDGALSYHVVLSTRWLMHRRGRRRWWHGRQRRRVT